jgi:predicted DsbA family dithiol-disulfide isomerase
MGSRAERRKRAIAKKEVIIGKICDCISKQFKLAEEARPNDKIITQLDYAFGMAERFIQEMINADPQEAHTVRSAAYEANRRIRRELEKEVK